MKLNEKWIKVEGINIRYVDLGNKNGKPILFLHGLGGRIEADSACFPYLERDFRIIGFDQPGSGYSEKPVRRYDLEYLVDFIFKFADALKLEEFYISGGSQGGLLALLCSAEKPERIIKSAIYSPSGVWGAYPIISNFFKILQPKAGKIFLHITSHFWLSSGYKNREEHRLNDVKFIDSREMPGFGLHVLGSLVSLFAKDRRPIFAKIKTPTLIFWGVKDYGQPIFQGRYLAKIMPNATLIEIPDSGHNTSTEKPEFFVSKIKEFFK